MKKALKARWVKALRSGKFEQVAGGLKDEEGGYCCLGVLCAISPAVATRVGKCWENDTLLSDSALEYAGFDDGKQGELATKNDTGQSFGRIATYIEKYL
jgi:hypothetical protein